MQHTPIKKERQDSWTDDMILPLQPQVRLYHIDVAKHLGVSHLACSITAEAYFPKRKAYAPMISFQPSPAKLDNRTSFRAKGLHRTS